MKKLGFLLIFVVLMVCLFTAIMGCMRVVSSTGDKGNSDKDKSIFTGDYGFNKTISPEVLNNYLSRSVTHNFLLYSDFSEFMEDVRMLENIGAKFIGRAAGVWGMWYGHFYWNMIKTKIGMAHQQDPEFLFQACLFETVHEDVESIAIPNWVFKEFDLIPEKRNFNYEAMLYQDGKYRDHWGHGHSVPDMSRVETQMWFFYRAARYIDAGIEAIHFGQVHLMNNNDPGHYHWKELLTRIREYASVHARRGMVLCDAHTHGIVVNGELLFDFHSYPLRPKDVRDSTYEAILEKGHLDSIYGHSKGGVTPSGWYSDSLPYVVEFDNYGGIVSTPDVFDPGYSVWGYDEISWFARQPEQYRNEWLEYAWEWVRANDPYGYLQFATKRTLGAHHIEMEWEGETIIAESYRANKQSENAPDGFSQEEVIKQIWSD